MSPSRARIAAVINANTRSESVSPNTNPSTPTSRSRASMTSSPSSTPLCAKIRPSCRNGWVLRTSSDPVVA